VRIDFRDGGKTYGKSRNGCTKGELRTAAVQFLNEGKVVHKGGRLVACKAITKATLREH
jgi:hypothetical protein